MTFIAGQKFQQTSFGEMLATTNVATIEGSASYNLIPANFRQFTATGGSISAAGRLFRLSTGTSVGGYAALQSFRSLPHRVGKSINCRFSGYFESNVADSWQGMGLLSIGEEISFGYNGTSFGVWHRYGGLSEVRTITVTGASGGSTNLTLTLNNVAYTIPLTSGSTAHNASEIALWLNANQSVWGADNLGSTVIINALSDGAKSGTYSFSHASATGTITQNTAGVTKTSNHIPQASWNGSVFAGFNPAYGNLYQIQYQSMGFGNIIFSIMNPVTNKYDIVHTLQLTNSGTALLTPNPSLRCGLYAISIGSTTNLNIYMNSIEASVGGQSERTRNPRSASNTQTINTTNETTILCLRNRRTYNGLNNQVEMSPLVVSLTNELNKSIVFRIRSSTSPTSELLYQTAGTNLVGDIATNAVTLNTGNVLTSATVASGDGVDFDLEKLQISMPPSLHLLITAQYGGASSGDVVAAINWYEDV